MPELYDDLLDEWTHDAHIKERNTAIANFQKFAGRAKCRVTFLSGDVHCCGLSRFRTMPIKGQKELIPSEDPRLMYQVISSAIVNMPPPRNALRAYHYFGMKWNPFEKTEEEFMNFFERMPEQGRRLWHRKLLPNRNWCFFEMVGASDEVPRTIINGAPEGQTKDGHQVQRAKHAGLGPDFWRLHWPFTKKHPYPSSLGPTSNEAGKGSKEARIHVHSGGRRCKHKKHHEDFGRGVDGDLRIRLWLESNIKKDEGRKFASYEVVIPPVL